MNSASKSSAAEDSDIRTNLPSAQTLFDSNYGMAYDTNTLEFLQQDSLLDTIPSLLHREYQETFYGYHDVLVLPATVGLYVDSTFCSERVFHRVVESIDSTLHHFCPEFYVPILKQARSTTDLFASFQRMLGHQKKRYLQQKGVQYEQGSGYRICVVVHKLYEDPTWITYYVALMWDEEGSNSLSHRVYYHTFNKKTGELLSKANIAKSLQLSEKQMCSNLPEAYKATCQQTQQTYDPDMTGDTLWQLADGCAIINEGPLFYYHQYTLGCGDDGDYHMILK